MKHKLIPIFLFIITPSLTCMGFDLSTQKSQAAYSIMVSIAECKFDSVNIAINSMIASDSCDPLGWMLLLSEISLRQLDYARSSDSDSFQETYERMNSVIATYEKRSGADSYLLTIKGISRLISAMYTMHRKKYFAALKMGGEALDLCNEAKKIDRGNVDVEFIIGFYSYARAELKRKFLGILFWYSGNKQSGIRIIENCSRNARLISPVADMVLQEIYVKEGKYEKASAGIERILAQYPSNRFALWSKAKLCDAQEMPTQAAEVYGSLADAYEHIPDAQKNFLATRFLEAERYFQAKNIEKARIACDRLLARCKGISDEDCEEAKKLSAKILHETNP
jgi:tetratricopeptide (TPR) repeat protein